ncbi:MAG: GNAT family N-acetyltransferase, partial [Anaerolineales bacterium]|nr:GNAT family N-acetyltransferase [Anaerolineales bacterium]
VADGYQSVGLGGQVLAHVLDLARQLTRRHVVLLGGTQATNARAIHFYEKHGFRTIGSFEEPAGADNFDMVLTLS